jgi:hypothetical protein
MSQIGARSAYLALRDFDPANVSCGPMLSKKVFLAGELNFSASRARLTRPDVRDLIES